MTSRTVAQIKTAALQYADMENSTFVSTIELIERVNESNARLYGIIANAGIAENYFKAMLTLNTVPNNAFVDVDKTSLEDPLDIYQVVGVDAKFSDNNWQAVQQLQWQDRNLFQNMTGWNGTTGIRYRIHGMGSRIADSGAAVGGIISKIQLELYPTPTAVYPIRFHYIPCAPDLTSDFDIITYPNHWVTWIALDVAIQLLNKEESDPRALMAERQRIELEIRNQAQSVDRGEVQRVRDTRSAKSGTSTFDPYFSWRR